MTPGTTGTERSSAAVTSSQPDPGSDGSVVIRPPTQVTAGSKA
jgi:hypothetical protein